MCIRQSGSTGNAWRSNNLEIREEILGTQVDNEGSNGPWLVEGIVNEKTTCSDRKEQRQAEQERLLQTQRDSSEKCLHFYRDLMKEVIKEIQNSSRNIQVEANNIWIT